MEPHLNSHAERARSIFLAALERADAAELAAHLDRQCGDDARLRAEVESLLRHHGQLGDYLERPAIDAEATEDRTLDREPIKGPGNRIGPYKLLESIGEGGMGTVYMAEQVEPVRRRVALKIIKPGMDSKQVIARFEAERQALALMDHPNIAKVLDAGTTPTGRPYFVMELVRGIPITDYCDQAKLPIAERLELFILVCRAVQHAHQKGVIHRDLKPSNILVTLHDGVPVPKVIDFGVAKATGQSLTEKTLYTGFAQLVGTPLYMSPEQAELSGLDVDTRSDVYSLGVLLYELLTGTTPFDRETFKTAALGEICRIIREDDPPSPSLRVTTLKDSAAEVATNRHSDPKRLGRAVRGELDWITMKCLEKDRNRRYETVNGLAADLWRYLADEPVQACPPSTWYRIAKFARRNRTRLITASLVAMALVVGTGVSTWQALRAHTEARNARSKQAIAEAINDFLTNDLLKQARPDYRAFKDQVTLLEVLDRAAERVGQRFGSQPEVEEALRRTIARTYVGLTEWEKAGHHYRAALELARRLWGPDSAAFYRSERDLALTLCQQGRFDDEVLSMARRAAEGLERTLGPDHQDTLISRHNLAMVYHAAGRIDEAIALDEATLQRRESKLGSDHQNTLGSRNNLAVAYLEAGRTAEAIALDEAALQRYESKLGADHPDTLASRCNLANAYWEAGRLDEAIALHEATLRQMEARLGPDHEHTIATCGNLASCYAYVGRLDEAIPLHEAALQRYESKLGPDHPNTLMFRGNLALDYLVAGRTAEAIALHEATLQQKESKLGPDHPLTLNSRGLLAQAYLMDDRLTDVLSLMEKNLSLSRARLGPDHPETLASLNTLAEAYLDAERWSEAESTARECLGLRSKKQPDNWEYFHTMSQLGAALAARGVYSEAEPLLLQGYEGLKARETKIPSNFREPCRDALATASDRVITLFTAWGKTAKAAEWRQEQESDQSEPSTPGR